MHLRGDKSNALFLKGGKQSLYELRASYQAIPRRIFDTTVTPYLGSSTDTLTLPTNWVRAPTTQQMTALQSTLEPVPIGWDWDVVRLGFDLSPTPRWEINTDYTRTERVGLRRSSGSFFFDAVEFAAPVSYKSDDLELAVGQNPLREVLRAESFVAQALHSGAKCIESRAIQREARGHRMTTEAGNQAGMCSVHIGQRISQMKSGHRPAGTL